MRIFLFILLSVVFGTAAHVWAEGDVAIWNNTTQATEREIVAFIGQKTYVEKRNLDQYMDFKLPDGTIINRKIPNRNDRFEARYDILSQVKGTIEADSIDFVAYDHFGRPSFPKFETVLLFLINDDGQWVKMRNFYAVQRTTDGDWAMCGGLGRENYSEEVKKLAASYEEQIQVEPVIFQGEKQDSNNENSKYCSRGTRASNIYKFKEYTSFGPERRRIHCNREMGVPENQTIGIDSRHKSEEKKQIHAACVERLELKEGLVP